MTDIPEGGSLLRQTVRSALLATGTYYVARRSYDRLAGSVEAWRHELHRQSIGRAQRACAELGIPLSRNAWRLRRFHNLHRGRRCVVIGNGPSLNKCDLARLKDEFTFGVNAIYLNYEKMGFHPTYYVVEDRFVAQDRANEIKAYRGPRAKFFGKYLAPWLGGAVDAVWLDVDPSYHYANSGDFRFSTRADRIVHVGGTVTFLSLQLAYYMGFSEVYMIGFDHHYTVPKEDMVNSTDIHSSQDDPNHFHPSYFGKGKRWHHPRVDRMEQCYMKAKEVFEADARKIYNATVGGHLEVFDRVDYDSLFR